MQNDFILDDEFGGAVTSASSNLAKQGAAATLSALKFIVLLYYHKM